MLHQIAPRDPQIFKSCPPHSPPPERRPETTLSVPLSTSREQPQTPMREIELDTEHCQRSIT